MEGRADKFLKFCNKKRETCLDAFKKEMQEQPLPPMLV